MDDFASATAAPTLHGKVPWPGGPSIKQDLSLPSSLVYYFIKNPPTSKMYVKLIQCCKYFFEKNSIIIASTLIDGSTVCSKKDCKTSDGCCVKTNINKLTSKIWLTDRLVFIRREPTKLIPTLRSKIFKNDIHHLGIFKKSIKFDDFQFLAASASSIFLESVKMSYNDGSTVLLEKILEAIPCVTNFFYDFCNDSSMVTASTFKNIIKLQQFQQLKQLYLFNIPEAIAVETLSALIKDHKSISFQIDFDINISEIYMDQLDSLIDTVIQDEVPNRMIYYPGQDKQKYKIMKDRFIDGELVYDK